MAKYEFTLILAGCQELTEELANAIFAAGCDDATPHSSSGMVAIDFDREAPSLEAAIRSAIAHVQKAGGRVASVRIDADAAALRG